MNTAIVIADTTFVCLYAVAVVIAWYFGHSIPGYTTLIMIMALLGSIQLIGLGIMGEYLWRVYDQTRKLPPFVIQEEDPIGVEISAAENPPAA